MRKRQQSQKEYEEDMRYRSLLSQANFGKPTTSADHMTYRTNDFVPKSTQQQSHESFVPNPDLEKSYGTLAL